MASIYSWPIGGAPSHLLGLPAQGTAPVSGGDTAFQGVTIRGLLRPFVRDGVSDFASGSGSRLLNAKIGQIVGTRCSNGVMVGELPWRPEFGSLIHLLRHSNGDVMTRELGRTYIEQALRRWLPSILVSDVEVLTADDTGIPNTMGFRIWYKVRTRLGTTIDGTADIALPAAA